MRRHAVVALIALLASACDREAVDPLEPASPSRSSGIYDLGDPYGNLVLSDGPAGFWRHREADLYGAESISGARAVDASGNDWHGVYRSISGRGNGIYPGDETGALTGNPMRSYPGGAAANFGYFSEGVDRDYSIDDDGARIEIPHQGFLANLRNFSFEAWVRPRPGAGWQYALIAQNSAHQYNQFGNNDFGYFLLGYWSHPAGPGPEFVNRADIAWGVASYNWSGWSWAEAYDYEFAPPGPEPGRGAETHIVGVHRDNVISLYVNGELVGTRDISGDTGLYGPDGQRSSRSGFRTDLTDIYNPPDPAKPLVIGGSRFMEGDADFIGFSGSIGESAFYGHALSAAQIAAHYAAGRTGAAPADLVLTCTPPAVERGEEVRCTLGTEPAGASITDPEWRFDGGGFTVQAAGTLEWQGEMVVSGTVSVTAQVDGLLDDASASIVVAPRDWSDHPIEMTITPLDAKDVLPLVPDSAADLGRMRPEAVFVPGGTWLREVPTGPNSGLVYIPAVPLQFDAEVIINYAAMHPESAWVKSQRGPYPWCRSKDLGPLLPYVIEHEGLNFEPGSHTDLYREKARELTGPAYEALVTGSKQQMVVEAVSIKDAIELAAEAHSFTLHDNLINPLGCDLRFSGVPR